MSRAGLRGARRTRVYDCNYNAGEKYYKPALDNLDRKYYGKWVVVGDWGRRIEARI